MIETELKSSYEKYPDRKNEISRIPQNGTYHPSWPIELKQQAIEAFDSDIEFLHEKARKLIEKNNFRGAEVVYRKILNADSFDREAVFGIATCLLERSEYQGALLCAQKLNAISPSGDSLALTAKIFLKLGDSAQALSYFNNALAEFDTESSELFEIYKNIGNLLLKAGDIDGAEENYNRALRLRPESDILFVNYGSLEIQRNNLETAANRYRTALQLNPKNDKAWLGLALIAHERNDSELAWANLLKCLDLNPENQTALQLIIEWGIAQRKWHISIDRVREYLEKHADDAEMAHSLACLYFTVGSYEQAKQEAERTYILNPQKNGIVDLLKAIEDAKRWPNA